MISQISSNIHIYIYKSQIFPQVKTNPPAKLLMIAQLNEGAVFLPNLIRLPFFFFLNQFFFYLFLFIGASLNVLLSTSFCACLTIVIIARWRSCFKGWRLWKGSRLASLQRKSSLLGDHWSTGTSRFVWNICPPHNHTGHNDYFDHLHHRFRTVELSSVEPETLTVPIQPDISQFVKDIDFQVNFCLPLDIKLQPLIAFIYSFSVCWLCKEGSWLWVPHF